MAKSMTGYGIANFENEKLTVSVEVKTLNSKFLDVNFRLPKSFSDKELEVRNLVSEYLERGKVSFTVEYARKEPVVPKVAVNKQLFKAYYDELLSLAQEVNSSTSEIFKMAIQSPEVLVVEKVEDGLLQDWELVKGAIVQALDQCNQFRKKEGDALKIKLLEYIDRIGGFLAGVEEQDPARVVAVKERIRQNLEDVVGKEQVDQNRFEQELIYYIEKMDISEEKVRLKTHLNYFKEIIKADDTPGKKLGFLAQEIGREINTIGSKANDALMQKNVVGMKEELEKIKEQLLNLL
jgi:uncharacterized protein (TIGR00255 family)